EFRRHGIDSVLLKGRSIAHRLYGDSTTRTYADVDLFVAPDRHRHAGQVMAALGFHDYLAAARADERPQHADAWTRAADGAVVDLHRTLSGVPGDPARVWSELGAHVRPLVIGTEPVPVLDDVGLALHIALHATRQGERAAKPLADLELALATFDDATMDRAAELADRLGALPNFVAGLRLLPQGRRVAARYGQGLRVPAETAVRIATGQRGAVTLSRLSALPGRRRPITIARLLFPSPALLRRTTPLAQRGRLALPAAYAVRLVTMAVGLPAAVRAWRAASGP
ncbi:MAG TPA: nucleotidyltransferase family protein, partial [Actinoplanes sp.]|nr:nucleotidyltransferase family protein [Actinoplanes sp.]